MNTAPDKKKAPEKIDDIVALLMAIGVMQTKAEVKPKPQIVVLDF